MPRVKRGKAHLKRRKKILKQVKGYKWGRKKLIKLAKTAIVKAGDSAFRDRKVKKRTKRALWHIQIGALLKEKNLSYSKFINLVKKSGIVIDRKILADLAKNNEVIFKKLVDSVTRGE